MVDGFYWSPSIDNGTQSYFLDIADTRLFKTNSSNKRFGRALRYTLSTLRDRNFYYLGQKRKSNHHGQRLENEYS